MIADLKPYPDYRDSGLPWLGVVPEHWSTIPLKRWVNMNRAVLPESTPPEQVFRYLDIGSVGTGVLTAKPQRLRFAAAPSRARRIVREGDTIVSTVRTYLKAVYFVDCESEDLICSTGFTVLTPRSQTVPKFVSYLCQSNAFTDRVTAYSVGIAYPAIDETTLGSFHIAIPTLPDQAAIVRFLDWANSRLDRAIRAKRKMIKLLNEQKQAIIHQAVTRGLDPNVKLKPSGVERMGDVPEHWQISRAATVCRFLSTKAHEQFVEPDGEHICVTARFVSTNGNNYRRCTENFSPACRGDVLMVMSDLPRGRALARAYLVKDDRSYAVNQRVCILRPFNVHPQFLAYIADRHPDLLAHDDGFNQTHLPNAAFKIMRLPLPPPEEQAAIAEYLSNECAALGSVIAREEREVELLGEYRIRLTADVVTGKLDVREAAARLPEELEAPSLQDEPDVDVDDLGDADVDVSLEAEEA